MPCADGNEIKAVTEPDDVVLLELQPRGRPFICNVSSIMLLRAAECRIADAHLVRMWQEGASSAVSLYSG